MRQSRTLLALESVLRETPAPDAHVVELGTLRPEAGLDVAQALPTGQLAKGHAKVLLEAVEGLELVIAAIAPHAMPEGVQGQVVEQLGKNEFARIHGAIRINGELQHLLSEKPSSSR